MLAAAHKLALVSATRIWGTKTLGLTDLRGGRGVGVRRVVLIIGAVLLFAGIIALLEPVRVSGPNGNANCGMAISGGDLTEAQQKDNNVGNAAGSIPLIGPVVQSVAPQTQTHYVAECNSAIATRLGWSAPLAVVGALVIAGSFVLRNREPAR
jgi:hypothetical protein